MTHFTWAVVSLKSHSYYSDSESLTHDGNQQSYIKHALSNIVGGRFQSVAQSVDHYTPRNVGAQTGQVQRILTLIFYTDPAKIGVWIWVFKVNFNESNCSFAWLERFANPGGAGHLYLWSSLKPFLFAYIRIVSSLYDVVSRTFTLITFTPPPKALAQFTAYYREDSIVQCPLIVGKT